MGVEVTKVGEITITSRAKEWSALTTKNMNNALKLMAEGINQRASLMAPVKNGALKSNGRVESIPDGVRVIYGDSRVPYARKRHFENKKNPQTLQYLSNAGKAVAKQGIQPYL